MLNKYDTDRDGNCLVVILVSKGLNFGINYLSKL